MGLISGAINDALIAVGSGLMSVGETALEAAYGVWSGAAGITISYARQSPASQGNAWALVTGNLYSLSLSVAASLSVLYFVIGWLADAIDIRNNFMMENIFKFFIRYLITVSLIANSLALVEGITTCTGAVVATVATEADEMDSVDGIFDEMRAELDEQEDGGAWLSSGVIGLLGGLIGALVVIVCSINLILAVLSRLFKMLLCIPFAPVALAGFAGGHEFSRSGKAWLMTYLGYALEALVIVLALLISLGLFRDAGIFDTTGAGWTGVVLQICEFCMPMLTACACVRGADTIVRRCLGLG